MTRRNPALVDVVRFGSYSVGSVLIGLVLCAAEPAGAQTAAGSRGTTGLSGAGGARSSSPHRLDFTLSPAEGYDTGVPDAVRGRLGSSDLQAGGYSTMLMANADYAWRRPAARVRANGSSAVRYYDRLEELKSVSHAAGLGLSLGVPGATVFDVEQVASYSPSYFYRLFPSAAPSELGVPVEAAPDYRVDDVPSYAYSTRVSVARGEKRRGRLSGTGEFDRTDFQGQPQLQQLRPDLRTYGAGAQYEHGVARNVTLSAGYHYRTGEFGYGARTTEQSASFGFEYSRALSRTRRANYGVHISPSRLSIPASAERIAVTGDVYRLSGDASFNVELLRTWQVGASVRRRLEYVASLGEPVFADGVSVNVGGFVTRVTQVSVSAAYSSGESALNRNGMTFDSYTGNVRLQRGLTRTLAAYGEYLYYFYDFRGASNLPVGVPPRFERNGVRAGLTLWIQALGR